MATMVLDRTTPMDSFLAFLGVERVQVSKQPEGLSIAPVVDPDDIDPDDYPDTTAYLNAIPGMAESLIEMMNAPDSEFERVPEEYFHI